MRDGLTAEEWEVSECPHATTAACFQGMSWSRGGGVPGGEAGERVGEPGLRIDTAEFAGLDERGDHRPVVTALVGAGEQGVLAIESERADRAFDGFGVDLDTAIIKEPAEPSQRLSE